MNHAISNAGSAEARPRIYGVGINDSSSAVYRYESKRLIWVCPFYVVWTSMLVRCYSAAQQIRSPTYIGCSVSPEWLSFSAFRAWMQGQNWLGKQLDKDILVPGNKVYSADTCAMVSRALNSFMTDGAKSRGDWPIGVCLNKSTGKFQAQCNNPFVRKIEYLGVFDSPDDAHEAWRFRKHELALVYADQQEDPRIAAALRLRFAKEKQL